MGEIALAAKITHVPSMYLSEQPGPHQGCREQAIEGHRELSRRARERGVDTILVFDVHWLVNSGYHINCKSHFEGTYTSNELPHFIKDMNYAYPGNPQLGRLIAEHANRKGVGARSHEINSLELEYGTLVPCRYMNEDQHFKVVSVAAWCAWHTQQESRVFGEAVKEAIEASDSKVMVLASGSLSHRFQDNRDVFTSMLPEYAEACHGEGGMHDTVMLLGMLGWDKYQGKVEVIGEYFASSGTGQLNAEFPIGE